MANQIRRLAPERVAPNLDTSTDLPHEAVREVSAALNGLLADTLALFLKTKNFHWHVSGPHFRSHHLLFDEQAEEIADKHDDVATTSILETFIDSAEKRCWFLFEASRGHDRSGH